jgi:hypothetical protein
MNDLLRYEPAIRLGCFSVILLLTILWEWRQPRRTLNLRRIQRWPNNLGVVVVDSIVVRLVFPIMAVGAAEMADARGSIALAAHAILAGLHHFSVAIGLNDLRPTHTVP